MLAMICLFTCGLALAVLPTASLAQSLSNYPVTVNGHVTTVALPMPEEKTVTVTRPVTTIYKTIGVPQETPGGEIVPITVNGYTTTITLPDSVFTSHPTQPLTLSPITPIIYPSPAPYSTKSEATSAASSALSSYKGTTPQSGSTSYPTESPTSHTSLAATQSHPIYTVTVPTTTAYVTKGASSSPTVSSEATTSSAGSVVIVPVPHGHSTSKPAPHSANATSAAGSASKKATSALASVSSALASANASLASSQGSLSSLLRTSSFVNLSTVTGQGIVVTSLPTSTASSGGSAASSAGGQGGSGGASKTGSAGGGGASSTAAPSSAGVREVEWGVLLGGVVMVLVALAAGL